MSLCLDDAPVPKVTPLGKRLRASRSKRRELMVDMAKKLQIGTAELSGIELGKCELSDKAARLLELNYSEFS